VTICISEFYPVKFENLFLIITTTTKHPSKMKKKYLEISRSIICKLINLWSDVLAFVHKILFETFLIRFG